MNLYFYVKIDATRLVVLKSSISSCSSRIIFLANICSSPTVKIGVISRLSLLILIKQSETKLK